MPDPGLTADSTPRTHPPVPGPGGSRLGASLRELGRLDQAVYVAVAESDTPTLDAGLRRLSLAADKSKLWLGVAALLALAGGPRGRRAAVNGVVSIGVASAAVNLGFKPLARRARPIRGDDAVSARHVRMPGSTSFPSGHSASAFAFAEGVGAALPWPRPALLLAAATVAESRVHCGVHYPGDVVAGSLIGLVAGRFAAAATKRAWSR
ncbi:MAG TPA: phosphatase PAP2 family protein [Nocardioidaceae bacterium]|nr:phosphatase PAP2 family protein [Nocardioidaceae bacterium]